MELVNLSVIMTSLELVGYINSIRKEGETELRHSDFLIKVPKVLNGGERNFSFTYTDVQNKERPCYNFPKREACLMAMSYSYELQALVFDKMTALENELKEKVVVKAKTPLELAKEQVALYEAIEVKEKELQLAIATKAEIGSRREATAMNTASQAVKKANALEIELDKSKEYCTVKRMQMLHHGISINWRLLKSAGVDLGIESIEVFDQNYGSVKAYHRDVWLEAYALTF